MAYCISYDGEKHILHVELMGIVTPQEVNDMHQICAYYLDEVERPIRLMIDARWLNKFPMNMRQNVRHSEYLANPMLRDVILLGDDNAINFLFILLSQMYQFKLILATPTENCLQDAS